ncbi:MAG: hypothetical protein QOH76_2501 [Thermoleophilaceae bacterium]|nr:hypothetical protein [Thermoleophilaceae bacterium]
MRISVALAARNSEQYLTALLDSLARQSRLPDELVVYDDASTDASPHIFEAFAQTAPFPVRILRGARWAGHVVGFLTAARAAEGDAIAFCDADDVWRERKLELSERELSRADATLVLHTTRIVNEDLRDRGQNWPEIEESRVAEPLGLTGLEIDAPGMAMLFRRELLDAADFDSRPPSRYGNGRQMLHDEWVFFLAGALGRIALIAEPLLLYRQHGANDSGGWVEHRRRLGLRPALDDYRRAAEHTGACAEYLERTAAGEHPNAARLLEAAAAYRQTAANWSTRVALYDAADRRSRAQLLRRLMTARAYRARTVGGFGRAALGKDLAAGLALRVPAQHARDDG